MFGIEFENYDSVKKKLDVLTGQINKGTSGSVKLNIDTEQIMKTISNLSNLAKKEIQILPDGQITVLSKFNAELGKTITLKENLSKKETTIGISDDEEKRLREYTKLFDQAIKQEDTLKKAREDQYKGLFDEAIKQEQQLAKERQTTKDSEWKEMEVVYKQEQAFIEASQKLKQKSSQESLKQIKEEANISNKLLEEKYKEAQSEKDQLENAQKLIAYEKQRLNLKLEGIKANRKDLVNSNDTDSISNNINNLKGNNVSEVREKVRQLNLEMQKLDQTAKMKGLQVGNKNIMSLGESIKSTATKLGIFVSTAMVLNQVQNTIRNATEYIIELDKSMIDLKKVTDETSETYDRFLNKMHNVALELGTQSNLMVDATTNWAKTGKNLEEASKLAENTILLTKVGDVDNVGIAQTYMLPALKAFNIEAEDSINLINEYNNISNNMATTVNSVGDAMSKSASSMSVAGNSLEQTIALIATADSATQLGGAEIGTALKSLSMRLAQFKDEDGEVIPKLAEQIKSLTNVDLTKANGELKNTYEIYTEIGKVYKDLDKNSQLQVNEVLGGKLRGNVVSAILTNVEELDRAYGLATDSAGSAMNEFKTYQEGIGYALDQLKEQVNGLYASFIDGGFFKGFINGASDVVSIITKVNNTFGTIPTVVATVVGAMTIFNSKFRESIQMMLGFNPTLNKVFMNLNNSTQILTKQIGVYQAQISQLKALSSQYQSVGLSTSAFGKNLSTLNVKLALTTMKLIATKVATIALEAVLSMGLSLAISAVVGVISSFVSSLGDADERIQAVSESSKALADSLENIKTVKLNVDEYEKINKKLKDTALSEQERNDLNDQLLQVKEQLYTSDEDAYSILNNQNLSYQEQLDLLRSINEEKVRERAEDLDKTLGNGFWNQDEEKNAKSAKIYIENNVNLLKELIELQEKANGGTINHSVLGVLSPEEQASAIENLKGKINESNLVLQKYNSNVELIEKANIDTDRSTISLSDGISEFMTKLNQSTQEIKDNTDAKKENVGVDGVGSSDVGTGISEATQKYSEEINKAQQIYDLLQSINDEQAMTPSLIKQVTDMYDDIGSSVTSVAETQDFLNNKLKDQKEIASQAYEDMVINDNKYYSSKLLKDENWINSFRKSLMDMGMSQEDAYNLDLKKFDNLQQLKTYAMNTLGSSVGKWLSQYIDTSVNGYDIDFKNFKSYAEAKEAILKALNEEIKKVTQNLASAEVISSSISSIQNTLPNSMFGARGEFYNNALEKAQSNVEKYSSQLKNLQGAIKEVDSKISGIGVGDLKLEGVGFNPVNPSSSSSSKKDSSSKEKEIENLELERDRYFEIEESLKKVNNELDKNNSLKDKQVTDKVLEKEISLLKQTISLNKKLRDEKVKQSAELKNNIKSWFSFDKDGFIKNYDEVLARLENWTNSVSGDRKEYRKSMAQSIVDDAKNYMDLINSEIPDIDKTILDTTNKITNTMTEQVEFKIESITKTIDNLTKTYKEKIDNLDFKKSHFADYSYSDNIKFNKEEITLSKKYLSELESQYSKLNKVIGTTTESKETLSETISDINDKIQEEKLNILELTKEQEKLNLSWKESAYQSKMWQKGTQQMNKIELELQVVDEDDVAKQVQLMNEKLKLQQSMLKDTEKYLQDLRNTSVTTAEGYGDLVDKLMSAEEQLYSQQSAVNSLKDSMDSLLNETMTKYINQLKEIEQLELDVRQQRENQALDEEYFKVSEKDFNAYKKEKISSINEEIKLLKDKLVVEGGNSALLDLLKAKQKELLSIEEDRYETVSDWYSVQEDMHKFNISKIEEELKALEEKNALEEENEARLEKQNELIEIQKELTNIKNNKNIRELQKNSDGSWGFEYTYDKEDYENTEKQYKEKQEALLEWEKDLELDKYKSKLEKQKEYEQESLNSLKEMYDKQKEMLDKIHEEEDKALEEKYNGMLDNLDTYLAELSKKFGDDVPQMIEILQAELTKGETILKDFGKSLSDLLANASVDEKQKEEFFKLFEDRYNDVIAGTTKFFETQKAIRTASNEKEMQDIQGQGNKVGEQTTSNLKTLSDIYKNGWDAIMSNMQSVFEVGAEKVESFNQQIISSTSQAISEISRLQSAYEDMQRVIVSTNQISTPNVSALSLGNSKGNTNVTNTINASFPFAKNSSEIEKALNNLSTRAIQYDK